MEEEGGVPSIDHGLELAEIESALRGLVMLLDHLCVDRIGDIDGRRSVASASALLETVVRRVQKLQQSLLDGRDRT